MTEAGSQSGLKIGVLNIERLLITPLTIVPLTFVISSRNKSAGPGMVNVLARSQNELPIVTSKTGRLFRRDAKNRDYCLARMLCRIVYGGIIGIYLLHKFPYMLDLRRRAIGDKQIFVRFQIGFIAYDAVFGYTDTR